MGKLRQRGAWIALAAVLAAFWLYRDSLGLDRNFGYLHDDTIYLSTAQALADGRGYVVPSIPGEPPQTKYPVLYPWILSWLAAPGVAPATAAGRAFLLNGFLSLAFLGGAYALIARWRLAGPWTALACCALTAFHFFFLRLSGAVMSDVPFAALSVWSLWAFERAAEESDRRAWPWLAGVLAALAVGTRTAGLALPGAFALLAIYRRQWLVIAPATLPAVAAILASSAWKATLSTPPPSGTLPGFEQTWLYWTAYGAFWLESVPTVSVLWNMLNSNAVDVLVSPSEFVFGPWLSAEAGTLGLLASVSLTAGILSGWWREARAHRTPALALAFVGTLPLVLLWNYPIADRLLMIFLPFFFAGAAIELRHVGASLLAAWRQKPPVADRVVLAGFALLLPCALGVGVHGYFVARTPLADVAAQQDAHWREAAAVYAWIHDNTQPDERFIASEDVHLYLHTGRQAMWPLAFTTQGFFDTDPEALRGQLDRFFDVALQIDAHYWVVADTDYPIESRSPEFAAALAARAGAFPELFRSPRGTMRVLDLADVDEAAARFRAPPVITTALPR